MRRRSTLSHAKWLEDNKFPSDEWLKSQWKNIKVDSDEFNSCEGKYIPDLINRKWKYIVECDWKSHDTEYRKKYDMIRDIWFIKKGYQVYRVRYCDYSQMKKIKELILSLRDIYSFSKR